ncbi:hypothetical protein FJ951_26950 [Mesorhizobium sp. B2-2-3]|uniref:hypothetical protein n=1 Tax=Mesorhizobium sp. B2-2-3 TaxID=2589963 RepID=UPI0011275810|nr:hypothetical protein [Mesorhizobium sp. B2-2-3]TPM39349.1 hypothetical protein FJ951_26950 [Mesorhizobium sp. B2-2-3]
MKMDVQSPDIFDRMASLVEEDKTEFLAAIKEHNVWNDVRKMAIDDAIDLQEVVAKDDHDDAIANLEKEIAQAPDFTDDADRLHDAICEGSRQDAVDILNDITNGRLRSVREQRNLFPDRVPA